MAYMWAGRAEKQLNKDTNDFNSSFSVDSAMYLEDISGSIAHAKMLAKTGIISKADGDLIVKGLKDILADFESGKIVVEEEPEDIHMFVESLLTARIGDAGKKLHTARSRNDQVALDTRLYVLNKIKCVKKEVKNLLTVITEKAEENADVIMPAFTHLQHAQPTTFAHYMMAYASMFMRDYNKLITAFNNTSVCPLGSGALCGTSFPIDRSFTAKELGFNEVCFNSIDGVSDRDFIIETASVLSTIMMHLSRFSEEIILWCSQEYKYIELDDGFSTGSSMMPQKKNPDIAELVRGKTGRVYGNLIGILTVMKGLPLAYNKDMQEDKEGIFDSLKTVINCLSIFAKMLKTTKVLKENTFNSAQKGFINATDCADYLAKKGMPFRSAYKIVGELVGYSIKNNYTLLTLPLDKYKEKSELFEDDIYNELDLKKCMEKRNSFGGAGTESVKEQLKICKDFLSNN